MAWYQGEFGDELALVDVLYARPTPSAASQSMAKGKAAHQVCERQRS